MAESEKQAARARFFVSRICTSGFRARVLLPSDEVSGPQSQRGPVTCAESHQPELLADAFESLDRLVEILAAVGGRNLATNPRLALGDDGKSETGNENPFVQHHVAHLYSRGGLTDDDRHDRRFTRQRLEP